MLHKDFVNGLESQKNGRFVQKLSSNDMSSNVTDINLQVRSNTTKKNDTKKRKKRSGIFTDFEISDIDYVSYYPTNEESYNVFNLLIKEVHQYLSDCSEEVIISAADLVLEILKDENLSVENKMLEIKNLLNSDITILNFDNLFNLSNRIKDYKVDLSLDENENNENIINISFSSETESSENSSDSEENENKCLNETIVDNTNLLVEDENLIIQSQRKNRQSISYHLSLDQIDEFYLQDLIYGLIKNENKEYIENFSQKLFDLLSNVSTSMDDLENELMELFNYEHTDFIKSCIINRWKIVYKIKILKKKHNNGSINEIFDEIKSLNIANITDEFLDFFKSEESTSNSLLSSTYNDKINSNIESNGEMKRKPRIIDLNYNFLNQDLHLDLSEKVVLPEGSFQENKKSYDIITIPFESSTETNSSFINLKSISDLPEDLRIAFPKHESNYLNKIQSKVFPTVFETDKNVLLCSPTGSGKTNVALLAILRLINNNMTKVSNSFKLKKFKVIYISPLKALIQEQLREFLLRLVPTFGMIVNELTGDLGLSKHQINESHLLITTPEKWDVITRKNLDFSFYHEIKLIIIDEIHLLHDLRGPVLESIIMRIFQKIDQYGLKIRLIGLSATLPNYKDIAKFIRVDMNSGLFYFDSSYRPCPLKQQYISIKEKKPIKKLNAINESCYEKLVDCLNNKFQLIIFVHSRKETYNTSKFLKNQLLKNDKLNLLTNNNIGIIEILKQESKNLTNENLIEVLPYGFGIHHAGLKKSERNIIEDLFVQGILRVLVSTATLAWGVNLPAHTVIIKGTEVYSPERGFWTQFSSQDIFQMLGRAGRPKYDTHGEGVIITTDDQILYYLAMLNQQLPIESQLLRQLPDCLNSEIVLQNIRSLDDGVNWLSNSYLNIRMLNSPSFYDLEDDFNDKDLYNRKIDLIHSALMILKENKLIDYDEETGLIKSNDLGKISSYFYINYETTSFYNNNLKSWHTEIDVLKIFSYSTEFKYIKVRHEEKFEIKKLLESCPYPLKEDYNNPLSKINVLLQIYISRLNLNGFELISDMIYVTQSAERLLRAMFEISLRKNYSSLSKLILNLCKMVQRRLWLSNSPLRQFQDVPLNIIQATEGSHLPWQNYFDLSLLELAETFNLKGNTQKFYDLLLKFPRLIINYNVLPITNEFIKISLLIIPNWNWIDSETMEDHNFLMIVDDCDGERILNKQFLIIKKKHKIKTYFIDLVVPIFTPNHPNYFVTFINQNWLHCEYKVPIILSDIKPVLNELVVVSSTNEEEISTIELSNHDLNKYFEFENLNKFQSTVFSPLFNTSDNIFIGSQKGNGKSTCAEIAIISHWINSSGLIVYLNPHQEIIDNLNIKWKKKFKLFLNEKKIVNKLTDDFMQDVILTNSSSLILSTPLQFDLIAKRWRNKDGAQKIQLLILDDVHEISNEQIGSNYESLISRFIFYLSQLNNKCRIIALSFPINDANDFGQWLGCKKENIFNFDPLDRFNKINEIRLQPIDFYDGDNIDEILVQRSFNYLEHNLKNNSNSNFLFFASNRSQSINLGSKLYYKLKFLDFNIVDDEIKNVSSLEKISDSILKKFLLLGIGFIYDQMDFNDRLIVEKLFQKNIIKIIFASISSCYFAPPSNNVVVLETQTYNYKESRYIDTSIIMVLEIIGCCKPNNDCDSKVLIFTRSHNLNFYNKFLNECLPIETCLTLSIQDILMNEISFGVIKNKQHCIDLMTFTFFYHRLKKNPTYYGVSDISHLGISEFLSEFVEELLNELKESNFIEFKLESESESNDNDDVLETIEPLYVAVIASYHNVSFKTIKNFLTLDNQTKLKNMFLILTTAFEFEGLEMRPNEKSILSSLNKQIPFKTTEDFKSPFFKAFVLLQAYLLRIPLPYELSLDLKFILKKILNVLYSCIDVLSTEGFLNVTKLMDLSQLIIHALWYNDNLLKQVPFFDDNTLLRCSENNIETIFDIMSLDDNKKKTIIDLENVKLSKVAEFINKYPNIDIGYDQNTDLKFYANVQNQLNIILERDEDVDDLFIISHHFPYKKIENWWIVLGHPETKILYAVKKVSISKSLQNVVLDFTIPEPGNYRLSLLCICDSYIGSDKEIFLDFLIEKNSNDLEIDCD